MGRRARNNPVLDGLQAFNMTYGLARNVMMNRDLEQASGIDQETIDQSKAVETTQGTEGMIRDSETGNYVPRMFDDQGQLTEHGVSQANAAEPEPVKIVEPTYKTETTRRYRLGDKEQDTPFSQEQVNAKRHRAQSDVYSRYGMPERAASIRGLAKDQEEQDVTNQVRSAGVAGLKNSKDLREDEKMYATAKGMYEKSLSLGRPDLATGYYNQMTQSRDALLAQANDRAERVYRSTGGNVSGFIDAYNRYVADGKTIDTFKRNDDGSHTFTINDGTGKTRDVNVPKEKLSEYLIALRDPKRIAEIEQKRAEILFKARADSQEKLNSPIAVGKDQTLIIPGTGQTFAPGGQRGFDPKESGAVLNDISKIFVGKYGKGDPNDPLAPKSLSDEGLAKTSLAQRLFMENRNLPPALIAEIADKGTIGQATVEIDGRAQKVPAISFNGRTFLIGGADAGAPTPAPASPASAPTKPAGVSGLGTRSVSGKIGQPAAASPGLQRVPSDSMQVSRSDQAARDSEAGRLRVAELGGVAKAQTELADLDAALKNPRLDGTQRRILQTERDLLAAGIAGQS